jgi:hypothetical protein
MYIHNIGDMDQLHTYIRAEPGGKDRKEGYYEDEIIH